MGEGREGCGTYGCMLGVDELKAIIQGPSSKARCACPAPPLAWACPFHIVHGYALRTGTVSGGRTHGVVFCRCDLKAALPAASRRIAARYLATPPRPPAARPPTPSLPRRKRRFHILASGLSTAPHRIDSA